MIVKTTPCTCRAMLAALLCCGCAGASTGPNDSQTFDFPLHASPRNAGANGFALVGPLAEGSVLRYQVSGVPPWVARPVQLYTFLYAGTCARHIEPPAFSLNDTVQVGLFSDNSLTGPFTMAKNVPAPFASLTSIPHALVVRSSAADGNVDLFCGDIARP
jgi:hypothetical protein